MLLGVCGKSYASHSKLHSLIAKKTNILPARITYLDFLIRLFYPLTDRFSINIYCKFAAKPMLRNQSMLKLMKSD